LSALVLLAAAACGSDDVDPQPWIDAVAEDIRTPDEEGDIVPDDEQAECMAEAIVGAADAERLEDADITPEEMAEAESFDGLDDLDAEPDQLREDLAEGLADCDLAPAVTEVFVAELPFELSEQQTSCVTGSLEEGDRLAQSLAASQVDDSDDDIQDLFSGALVDCPDVTADLLAESIAGAGVAVDDAARQCLADEMQSRGQDGVDQLLAGGAEANQLGVELAQACLAGAAGG